MKKITLLVILCALPFIIIVAWLDNRFWSSDRTIIDYARWVSLEYFLFWIGVYIGYEWKINKQTRK